MEWLGQFLISKIFKNSAKLPARKTLSFLSASFPGFKDCPRLPSTMNNRTEGSSASPLSPASFKKFKFIFDICTVTMLWPILDVYSDIWILIDQLWGLNIDKSLIILFKNYSLIWNLIKIMSSPTMTSSKAPSIARTRHSSQTRSS